jgi:signal transduction histidine kinase
MSFAKNLLKVSAPNGWSPRRSYQKRPWEVITVESELTQEILNLQPGDHLCLFYERDPAEQMPALIPFIQDAISRDEQFIYIADDQTVDELEGRLQQSGINVGKESDRGALKLWTRREWRQPGELSSERKSLQVVEFINEACKSGFKGSRFAVEMTWALGPDISADFLEHWEATINTIFVPGFPGRIACQYNQSRLSAEVILAALHTHPLAILGDHVYPNFFYEAPLILERSAKSSSARLEWMIVELKRSHAAQQERKRLEDRLRHAQKLESIGTLAGGIAHDFNNILNIIKGYTLVLGKELSGSPEVAGNLKVIDEAVERGASLVRQLLTIARKTDTHLTPININESISGLTKLIQQTFPKTIEVSLQLDPKIPPVMADPNQISQSLLNLCVNARDAMPAGGRLTLSSSMVDRSVVPNRHHEANGKKYVSIEVADTGKGMDESVRNRIFEPFFTTKGINEGTGLGLAMVYGIIKNHHGFVDVESEPGRGAKFSLYFPVVSPQENSAFH